MAVIAIDFGNLKIVVCIGSTSLQMTHICFILWKQVNLIEENVSGTVGDSFFTVFRLSRIERCIEVLQENRLKY